MPELTQRVHYTSCDNFFRQVSTLIRGGTEGLSNQQKQNATLVWVLYKYTENLDGPKGNFTRQSMATLEDTVRRQLDECTTKPPTSFREKADCVTALRFFNEVSKMTKPEDSRQYQRDLHAMIMQGYT